MFIRATRTHLVGGQPGYSYRLVRSVRQDGKVRQKTLLNLGTDFSLPRALWPHVTHLAEDLLSGQAPLLSAEPEVLAAAETLVRRLRARGFGRTSGTDEPVATVRLDSLAHDHPRSVGAERLALHALDDLGLPQLLRQAGASPRDASIAVATVLARMLHPSSEREALRWLRDSSATLELLGLEPGRPLSLTKLYRTSDLLWKHREALQEGLFARERRLLDLPSTILFYDLSNTHYSGRQSGTLLRYGRSKQKRSDCPLVSLALALDGAGFPRRCEILPGNVSEPGTLQEALQRLAGTCGEGAERPTVVMDAGIASEANLDWLREHGWQWICVSREAKPDPPQGEPAAQLRTSVGYQVQAWPLPQAESGEDADSEEAGSEADQAPSELRVYAVSEACRQTAESILERHRGRFETALRNLHAGLSKPGYLKDFEKVQRKVGRLIEEHKRVASQYEVQVSPGEKGKAKAVTFRHKPKHAAVDAAAGAYMLRTSHTDWDVERVLRTYWTLTEVESTFRELKSTLGLRPIWHRLDRRISGHLFIAVLAYHGVHLIRMRLKARGVHLSWASIRNRLANWVRITTTLQEVGGSQICMRQDVRPDAAAFEISRAAGVVPRLHRRRIRSEDAQNVQNVVPSEQSSVDQTVISQ